MQPKVERLFTQLLVKLRGRSDDELNTGFFFVMYLPAQYWCSSPLIVPQERGSDLTSSERPLSGVITGSCPEKPLNPLKKSPGFGKIYRVLRPCGIDSAQNSALKPRVAPPGKILRHLKKRPIGRKSVAPKREKVVRKQYVLVTLGRKFFVKMVAKWTVSKLLDFQKKFPNDRKW